MIKIEMTYQCVDNVHNFASTDPKKYGVCAAHSDLDIAYNEVAAQLKTLHKLKHGADVDFVPKLSVQEFAAKLPATNVACFHSA